jgi:hypothetical protein
MYDFKIMIRSGLVNQRRGGGFEKGFSSDHDAMNRYRHEINDVEVKPKVGISKQTLFSQPQSEISTTTSNETVYRDIFGKTTTADERFYIWSFLNRELKQLGGLRNRLFPPSSQVPSGLPATEPTPGQGSIPQPTTETSPPPLYNDQNEDFEFVETISPDLETEELAQDLVDQFTSTYADVVNGSNRGIVSHSEYPSSASMDVDTDTVTISSDAVPSLMGSTTTEGSFASTVSISNGSSGSSRSSHSRSSVASRVAATLHNRQQGDDVARNFVIQSGGSAQSETINANGVGPVSRRGKRRLSYSEGVEVAKKRRTAPEELIGKRRRSFSDYMGSQKKSRIAPEQMIGKRRRSESIGNVSKKQKISTPESVLGKRRLSTTEDVDLIKKRRLGAEIDIEAIPRSRPKPSPINTNVPKVKGPTRSKRHETQPMDARIPKRRSSRNS